MNEAYLICRLVELVNGPHTHCSDGMLLLAWLLVKAKLVSRLYKLDTKVSRSRTDMKNVARLPKNLTACTKKKCCVFFFFVHFKCQQTDQSMKNKNKKIK